MSKNSVEIIIQNHQVAKQKIKEAHEVIRKTLPSGPVLVTLSRDNRTLDQNAKMWVMLTEVSNQIIWHGQKWSKEDWKNMFSAALYQQRTAPGIEGGFVVLGRPTSKMSKREFSELIEVMYAFGANHGMRWTETNEDLIKAYLKWLAKERNEEARAA